MAQRKRVHNPKSGSYLKRRQRTTKKGKKGQIMGSYKPKKHSKKSGWSW